MLTKPPILDETGQKILSGITRIKDALLGTTSDPVTPGSAGTSGVEPVMQDDTGRDIIVALNDLGTAVKPASATDNGYVSTGAQTFAGQKRFTGSSAQYPGVTFTAANDTLYDSSVFLNRGTTADNKLNNPRIGFEIRGADSNQNPTAYFEYFRLPVVSNGITATAEYDILTTKGTRVYSGNCTTAAATAAKTVTLNGFVLQKGVVVFVWFTNTNSAAVADLTLNVNNTGALPIKRLYNNSVTTLSAVGYLAANQTYMFWYDGTNWVALFDYNSNTTYSAGTGLSLSSNTFNHSNSVTAQTTQAVYPIKIDAQGHISAYGTAQTILALGTTATTAAAGNHTHTLTIAADSGTNALTLAASTKYKLTAGGSTFIFTTPPNTTYSAGTGLSLSSTTFNHSNSVTAQTTQAVYPIKIDAQGHISAYGSAQTILALGTTATTAAKGNHTHSNYLGAVSDGTYYGMANPAGTDTVWIRTTSNGIIPYQSGGAGSGHCGLGTSSWRFATAYIDNVYGKLNGDCTGSSGSCTGNAATATSATTASKLGSSTVGGVKRPMYLSSGTATACNAYTQLFTGTFNSSSAATTLTGGYASYNYLVIVGKPNTSNTAISSVVVPTAMLTTSDQTFAFANENYGCSVKLKRSSNDVIMTFNASTSGNGAVLKVYGGI